MWRLRTLSSRILIAVLGILLGTVVIGGMLDVQLTRQSLDQQYEERARAVAAVVGDMSEIRSALLAGDPQHQIQALAARAATSAGASYVVVTDREGVRYSHPNPALIGRRLEEPVAVLDGRDHVGIDNGSLGRSANGKAPIRDGHGLIVGQVSVGIVETRVAAQVDQQAGTIIAYSALALAVGVAVSLMLARALKRLTFGLELRDLASLLHEREAMLHGIREGVLGIDAHQRISVINDEARRLLHVTVSAIGRPLADVIPSGRLRDLLDGSLNGPDQSVLTSDALLMVNRRPVSVAGRTIGSIVTLRDRTELETLIRRMNAVTGLSNALRAQEHEFTNRLHVIAGLLDLGEPEEARQYLDQISETSTVSAEDLRARIAPPAVAALLMAKIAVAAEGGVSLRITEDSRLDAPAVEANLLMSVIGNLVDNAIESTAVAPPPREVTVHLTETSAQLRVLITDTGAGVSPQALADIFKDGYSTKAPRGDLRRGIGLALVKRLVTRAGGSILVSPGPGGHFEVVLPVQSVTEPGAVASGAALSPAGGNT